MERMGMRDIEGKAARVAASERGQRASFNATNFCYDSKELEGLLILNSSFLLFFVPAVLPSL